MKKIALIVFCFLRLYSDNLVWEEPQVLSTIGLNVAEPQIGIDNNGDLVAAWIENSRVIANTKPYNESWGVLPIQISDDGASSLRLVVDRFGNATAIWDLEGIIQSSSLPFNGSWTFPLDLSDKEASSPRIAVDNSGNIAAIWICDGAIQSAIKPFNANWPQSPDTISSPFSPGDSPQIAIGGNEYVVAVWHSTSSAGKDAICSNQKKIGESWFNSASIISNGEVPSVYPQVAISDDGSAMAAWYRYDVSGPNYSNIRVQTSFGNTSGMWSDSRDLSSPGNRNPEELVLHVSYNSIGLGLVLWTNCYDYNTFNLEGSVYGAGAWIPTLQFVASNLYLYDQDFSISPEGYVCAAYMEDDSLSGLPIVRAFGANSFAVIPNYGDQITISNGGSNGYPRTTVSQVGSTRMAAAIWLNNNGSNTTVQAAIGQAAIITPPTSLNAVQNANDLGIFTEYYNTLSWQGVPPVNAKQWLIFRNGEWIGATPIDVLEFIDHNAIQQEPVVYGVAMQLQDGDQSQVTTVHFP